jgi:putative transposase
MANSFTQLHIQLIFAVQYRAALILPEWKERLHQFITGITQNDRHKMLQVNSRPDHIHILIGQRPYQSTSTLVQNIKTSSSLWINDNKFTESRLAWQEGFGAFSYSKSNLNRVIRYIQNQEQHHKKVNFQQEYIAFLDAFEIEYDKKYIFKDPE